jgi:hypothetical protein
MLVSVVIITTNTPHAAPGGSPAKAAQTAAADAGQNEEEPGG